MPNSNFFCPFFPVKALSFKIVENLWMQNVIFLEVGKWTEYYVQKKKWTEYVTMWNWALSHGLRLFLAITYILDLLYQPRMSLIAKSTFWWGDWVHVSVWPFWMLANIRTQYIKYMCLALLKVFFMAFLEFWFHQMPYFLQSMLCTNFDSWSSRTCC